MDISQLMQVISILAVVISVIAFVISLITEVTKNLGFLKKIPTDAQVIFLSMVLTILTYLAYASIYEVEVLWYMIVGAFLLSFLVAGVTMFGWKTIKQMWDRFGSWIDVEGVDKFEK